MHGLRALRVHPSVAVGEGSLVLLVPHLPCPALPPSLLTEGAAPHMSLREFMEALPSGTEFLTGRGPVGPVVVERRADCAPAV